MADTKLANEVFESARAVDEIYICDLVGITDIFVTQLFDEE